MLLSELVYWDFWKFWKKNSKIFEKFFSRFSSNRLKIIFLKLDFWFFEIFFCEWKIFENFEKFWEFFQISTMKFQKNRLKLDLKIAEFFGQKKSEKKFFQKFSIFGWFSGVGLSDGQGFHVIGWGDLIAWFFSNIWVWSVKKNFFFRSRFSYY